MLKHHNILPTKTNFFCSCGEQIENKQEFKSKDFRVAMSSHATGI